MGEGRENLGKEEGRGEGKGEWEGRGKRGRESGKGERELATIYMHPKRLDIFAAQQLLLPMQSLTCPRGSTQNHRIPWSLPQMLLGTCPH